MAENGNSDTTPSIAEQWEAIKGGRKQSNSSIDVVDQSWAELSGQAPSLIERVDDIDDVQCTLGELKEFLEFRGDDNGYSRWEKFQNDRLSFNDVAERFSIYKKQEGVIPERAAGYVPDWMK